MSYATIADMRAEGVTDPPHDDAAVQKALDAATQTIERLTGWFFDVRTFTVRMSGRGTPTLEPNDMPVSITEIKVNGAAIDIDPTLVEVEGPPVPSASPVFPRITRLPEGATDPRILVTFFGASRIKGPVFSKGLRNVTITGDWGFREYDGSPTGRVPLDIQKATMILAIDDLPGLNDITTQDDINNAGRLTKLRTIDQELQYAPLNPRYVVESLTGNLAVDRILARFRKQPAFGAV